MWKFIKKIFINGLIAVLPIVVTLALIIWLLSIIEQVFGGILMLILGENYYYRGMGLILGVIVVFLAGSILNAWTMKKLYIKGEKFVQKIPFVKSLYTSVRDLMAFFGETKNKKGHQVVMVSFGQYRVMGLLTREQFEDLPKGIGNADEVAVYFPMSYQIGGYLLIMPKSQIQPIDMTIEEAMRFTVTAGMILKKETPFETPQAYPEEKI